MRVLFFGSPEFAVPSLEALCASSHTVVGVVTQPDRPVGRGLAMRPSAVKAAALARGLPVHHPDTLRGDFLDQVRALAPDLLAVVAYGRILPPELLALPRLGAVNLHGSLLPRHRGAAPVQAAILAGDGVTGVTTMQMDAGLDTGPMLLKLDTAIGPDETAGELALRLARMGAPLLVETLERLARGDLAATAQDGSLATYAPKIHAADGQLDWRLDAEALARRVRAYQPWPGAYTTLGGRKLKLLRVRALAAGSAGEPGMVLAAGGDGIEVTCGAARLLVLEAQPEGRRAQSAADLVNGRQVRVGDRLGA